jgi:NCS2 family nucleobase:cation symporter-2
VSIPLPVLGGAGLVMFAMIISACINILSRVEHNKRNSIIVAVSIGAGMAVTVRPELLVHLPEFAKVALSSGITTGSLMALLLSGILPGREPVELDDDAGAEAETA